MFSVWAWGASSPGELIGARDRAASSPPRGRHNRGVDPFSVLGVAPGASPGEVSAAYREQAKRWHPDRGGGAAAAARMAEINVAYDVLRAGAWQRRLAAAPPDGVEGGSARPGRRAGAWLEEPLRRALGRELLVAL